MKRYILWVMLTVTLSNLFAQENAFRYEISNASEVQYNLTNDEERKPKFVNLVQLHTSLSTDQWWEGGSFELSFLSVAQSMKHGIADDALTFSNIEAYNHRLICSKLGYQHSYENIQLFVGIRNLNVDYFTSPYSSLFTNSSAGIFPTISLNYGLANYPLAGLAIHGEYRKEDWSFKNSFYNNISNINQHLVFNFHSDIKRHGYINISQLEYASPTNSYAVGVVFDKLPKASLNHSLYAFAEQQLGAIGERTIGILGQLGYAPKNSNECYLYYGAGLVATNLFRTDDKDRLGLIAYHAKMHERNETAVELTYRYELGSWLSIQPTFHYIVHDDLNKNALIGLLRATFTFGN